MHMEGLLVCGRRDLGGEMVSLRERDDRERGNTWKGGRMFMQDQCQTQKKRSFQKDRWRQRVLSLQNDGTILSPIWCVPCILRGGGGNAETRITGGSVGQVPSLVSIAVFSTKSKAGDGLSRIRM